MLKRHLKKGEEAPDFVLVIRLLCAELEATKDRMVETDEAHQAELDDDPPVRKARDERAAALYNEIVQLREMFTGAYGSPTAAELITGTTPEDPVVLARFAGEVAKKLDKATLPAPRIKGAKLDPAQIAESLRDKRAELEKTFKAVQREVREARPRSNTGYAG